jgi:hypothetical protein
MSRILTSGLGTVARWQSMCFDPRSDPWYNKETNTKKVVMWWLILAFGLTRLTDIEKMSEEQLWRMSVRHFQTLLDHEGYEQINCFVHKLIQNLSRPLWSSRTVEGAAQLEEVGCQLHILESAYLSSLFCGPQEMNNFTIDSCCHWYSASPQT